MFLKPCAITVNLQIRISRYNPDTSSWSNNKKVAFSPPHRKRLEFHFFTPFGNKIEKKKNYLVSRKMKREEAARSSFYGPCNCRVSRNASRRGGQKESDTTKNCNYPREVWLFLSAPWRRLIFNRDRLIFTDQSVASPGWSNSFSAWWSNITTPETTSLFRIDRTVV